MEINALTVIVGVGLKLPHLIMDAYAVVIVIVFVVRGYVVVLVQVIVLISAQVIVKIVVGMSVLAHVLVNALVAQMFAQGPVLVVLIHVLKILLVVYLL